MLAVIICKLYEWEQAGPVVLLVIDEDPQVGLQCYGVVVDERTLCSTINNSVRQVRMW